MFPRKHRPPRPPPTWKDREKKAILEKFKPLPSQNAIRTMQYYQQDSESVRRRAEKETNLLPNTLVIGNYMRAWQMDVPVDHPLGADTGELLQGVRQQIYKKLTEEISALNGIKFHFALRVHQQKESLDGIEQFTDPCSATYRRPFPKPAKSKRLLTKKSPTSWSCSKSGHREGRGGRSTERGPSG